MDTLRVCRSLSIAGTTTSTTTTGRGIVAVAAVVAAALPARIGSNSSSIRRWKSRQETGERFVIIAIYRLFVISRGKERRKRKGKQRERREMYVYVTSIIIVIKIIIIVIIIGRTFKSILPSSTRSSAPFKRQTHRRTAESIDEQTFNLYY